MTSLNLATAAGYTQWLNDTANEMADSIQSSLASCDDPYSETEYFLESLARGLAAEVAVINRTQPLTLSSHGDWPTDLRADLSDAYNRRGLSLELLPYISGTY